MIKEEAKKRIEKLKGLINRYRYQYHVKDTQNIPDSAFDSLKHELFQLESKYPDLITPDSPTQRVGGEPLKKFVKVRHENPMLSIEDVFSEDELRQWEQYLERLLLGLAKDTSLAKPRKPMLEYFSELKIDGFAVTLKYKKGVFSVGATRGNGRVGEDVTQNLKTIDSIPLKLEIHNRGGINPLLLKKIEEAVKNGVVEVRGEVYMEKKDFEKFNMEREKRGEDVYANPRNLAAGSIRQLNPKLAALRPLKFLAYGVVTDFGQTLHSQEHEMLSALGFRTDTSAKICKDVPEIIRYWKSAEEKRDSFPFLIDGVVAVINENSVFSELGVAGKSPRGIRALKFSGKQATTRILDVRFQLGRTGAVTPVAVLEPTHLSGVTVSRATLHNEEEIKRLGVKIGDTVIVERAGDVIPAVVKVLKELRSGSEKAIRMPSHCPVCKSKLVRPSREVIWRCPSKNCKAQKMELLCHFASKKTFDMKGVGPKIIDKLVEEHLITGPSDLFELTEEDLASLERFADKSAENIVASIQQSKHVSLYRFIFSLGIRHVGEETALDLASYFRSIQKLQSASREELEAIPDIGAVVAKSIYDWFREKANQELIEKLFRVGVRIQIPPRSSLDSKAGSISGKVFVLTGTLPTLTRDEAKSRVRTSGGEVSESVSKKTDYLIIGENPGSKLKTAKKLGIKILTEQEFLSLLD